jgi:hypothetical protein
MLTVLIFYSAFDHFVLVILIEFFKINLFGFIIVFFFAFVIRLSRREYIVQRSAFLFLSVSVSL